MTAQPDLLERATELFPAPEHAFERLTRRRDRKRRNQRIGVAVVALVLAAAAIGNLIVAFRSSVSPRPVDRGIDVGTVGDLTLAWKAQAPHTGVGWVGGASAGDGVLLVATNQALVAFDEACAQDGGRCSALWTATGRFGPLLRPPGLTFEAALIADGTAYVPGGDRLSAFDLACRSDGERCEPRWTSSISGDFTSMPMVRVDARLYGGFYDPLTGGPALYAMSTACASSVCDPAWVAHGWSYGGATNGVVFATSDDALAAFAMDCRDDGGECAPLWTVPGRWVVAGVDPGHVYAWTDDRLSAYRSSCTGVACDEPEWVASEVAAQVVVGPGIVVASSARGGRLLAFPPDCAARGGECRPSWVGRGTPWLVADGLVIATQGSGVVAYPVACRSDGGACPPTWISHDPRSSDGRRTVFRPSVVHDGVLFGSITQLGANRSFRPAAYALRCGAEGATCRPAWVSDVEVPGIAAYGPLVDGDHVFLAAATVPATQRTWQAWPTLVYAFGLPPASSTSGS